MALRPTSLVRLCLVAAIHNMKSVHFKCRGGLYPFTDIARLVFSDELVPWSVPFKDYNPPEYNSQSLQGKPYADPPIGKSPRLKLEMHPVGVVGASGFMPKWNVLDSKINRVSFEGEYQIVEGRPLNPRGRTGLRGRGVLGRWGPNHAADPIVTRWKVENGRRQIDSVTKL